MPIPYDNEEVIQTAGTAWAVTATHNFLSQSITESTPLTTAGLTTPGSENYDSSNLLTDHNISLPKAGSTSHFVSPNQPIFTFTKPTLVHMIIPITTATGPLRSAGWLYIPYTKSYLNPWLPGDPLPTLNSTGHYGADDVLSGLITNLGPDYLYGRVFPAGTHNLDPTSLAPLAFYMFEEKSFDYQVFTNTTNIATNTSLIKANTELLSASPGIATGGKALILDSSGDVVGDIKATGFVTGGFLQMGEGATTGSNNTSAQISHVNRYNDTDYAVRQLSYGPTFVNTSATRHIGFRVNDTEYMRVDGNASRLGNVGINTISPAQKLHVVGGSRFDLDGGQFRIFSGTTGTVDKFSVNSNGVYVSGSLISSDDRLKHNEETLINPLEIIRQLNPQKYQKTDEMRGADFKGEVDTNFVTEAGFIAQEVKAIPELAYCVTGGDGEEQHYLNYNNIFCYNVAATKELDALVTLLLAKVAALEARLLPLEL